MALIRRLDHIILCCKDRQTWVPAIGRVLGLRPGRSREGDEWGFSNAEFDIGDGFLGLVEPAGATSQLHRFLGGHPEGLYGVSVDVGDLSEAAAMFDAQGVPVTRATRKAEAGLLWMSPKITGGVLYQLTSPIPPASGTNPEYLGFVGVTVAVEDLDRAVLTYRHCFGLEPGGFVTDDRLGYNGIVLPIPGTADRIVLAAPRTNGGPLGDQLAKRGPGLFQFTIAVRNLSAETHRLSEAGIGWTADSRQSPMTAWIDPTELFGVRVELHQPGA